MLDVGKPTKLSRPALETLAIIAYRQPISRAEMEGVRGVTVDHVLRMLMEMQLIKIVGRSELPGRPMLYGTTQLFLEHFGLKDIKQLPGIEELARMEVQKRKETPAPVQEAAPTEPVSQPKAEGVTESSGTEVAT
jgi:segregation and condensation protein B